MRQSAKDMLRRDVASSYQVLIGAGRLDEATAVAQRLTEEFDDAESQNALAWAGYLTGAPVEANPAQARRAFEMTGGDNIAIIDTLARVLAALGLGRRRSPSPRRASPRLLRPGTDGPWRTVWSTAANGPPVDPRARSWCYDAPPWGISAVC